MHDGERQRVGDRRAEPLPHLGHRQLAGRVHRPELHEPPHLTLGVASRTHERREAGLGHVRPVDLDERVDQVEPKPAPGLGIGGEVRRKLVADHVALEVLHHVERRACDLEVVAHGDDWRDADALLRERELKPGLAHHVVRRRRKRRPRRPAEDEAAVVALEEEGEVRAARDADSPRAKRAGAQAVFVEERLQPVEDDERWKREALRRLGGLDDSFFGHAEGPIELPGSAQEVPRAPGEG